MNSINKSMSFLGTIETICKKGTTVPSDCKAVDTFELFEINEDLTEICIVDKAGHLFGVLTRNYVFAAFGGRYGFDLNQRRNVYQLMSTEMLVVDANDSIEKVSNLAMSRPTSHIYDAVIVMKNNHFYGVVSIKDLLTTVVSIQVEKAADANPLTELPGNRAIENVIINHIMNRNQFTVIYIDLDNFKAFNDAYGFTNGDNMIRLVADSLKRNCENDFIGHVGGDDFVIVTDQMDVSDICHKVTDFFNNGLRKLYNINDWKNGYITSVNRHGSVEQFPIASMSIAVIRSINNKFASLDELSKIVAVVKKKAKQINGNSIVIQ